MIHRLRNVGTWASAVVLGLSFLFLVSTGLYAVHHSRGIDKELCEQTVENRDAVRDTWNAARMLFLARSEQEEAVNAFFDDILKPIPALECVNNQPVPKEG